MEHLSIDREDECTSRLQESVDNEDTLELEACIPLASFGWANDGVKSHSHFQPLPKV